MMNQAREGDVVVEQRGAAVYPEEERREEGP